MATRNGIATLPQVLDAYCRLTPPVDGWRLLVVDNGSSDGTPELLATYAGRLPLRCLHEPVAGKNRALNRALEVLLAEQDADDALCIFTDDDATPHADWLLQWQVCARAYPADSVFGGAILPDWAEAPPPWLLPLIPTGLTYGLTSPSLPDGPVFPGLVWGANMAVRRGVFAAGHRFDTGVGPNGGDYAMGSETELTRRLAMAGYRARFYSGARVAHHIRPHQISIDYILQKAWRYGRGRYRQERPGRFPEWRGVPRWMWRRYGQELCAWVRAAITGDAGGSFAHRWELACLRGYFHEAWRGARPVRKMVLVASYSGQLGGMELRMAQEVRYLQAAGHSALLALPRFDGFDAWTQRLAREQVTVAEYHPPAFFERGWRWRNLRLWQACWLAGARLRAFRADLVHVAFCWTTYGASLLWLARRCGVPAVVSVHNAFPTASLTDWHARLLRQAFTGVRGVYAVSASSLAHFMATYRPFLPASTRLAVIPNCVDVDQFRPSLAARLQARKRLQVPQQALLIGVAARLSEQKRPELAIALVAALRDRFPDLHLVLIGGGPLEASLRAQVAGLGLTPWVIFTGFVDDVHAWMPALDLHLLMSRNEGFGIATIEAMACGVPAVATDVPGSADILHDCAGGMLVPAQDLDAAVAAVGDLLADPERRAAMGQYGREEAVRRYSVEVVGRQVAAFYDGLL